MLYREFDGLLEATTAVVDWWVEALRCTAFDASFCQDYARKRTRVNSESARTFGEALGTYIVDWFKNKPNQRELVFSSDRIPFVLNPDMAQATKGLIGDYDLPLGAWSTIERTGRNTLFVSANMLGASLAKNTRLLFDD